MLPVFLLLPVLLLALYVVPTVSGTAQAADPLGPVPAIRTGSPGRRSPHRRSSFTAAATSVRSPASRTSRSRQAGSGTPTCCWTRIHLFTVTRCAASWGRGPKRERSFTTTNGGSSRFRWSFPENGSPFTMRPSFGFRHSIRMRWASGRWRQGRTSGGSNSDLPESRPGDIGEGARTAGRTVRDVGLAAADVR